jgi:hypothetical protein
MIRDHLVPALKREFPGWDIAFDAPPKPIATFPAVQPAVGRVFIYDDGHEATVVVENVTHNHFNPYDDTLTEAKRDELVTEEVMDFLKALFSDRVLLHSSPDNGTCGWTRLDLEDEPVEFSPSFRYFLWSRPYTT